MSKRRIDGMRSGRDPWLYAIFLLFLGYFGIHRFYVGKIGMGIAYLLTGGFFGVGVLVDIIILLANGATDSDGAEIMADKGAKVLMLILIVVFVIYLAIVGTVVKAITWHIYQQAPYLFEELMKEFKGELHFEFGDTIHSRLPATLPAVLPAALPATRLRFLG